LSKKSLRIAFNECREIAPKYVQKSMGDELEIYRDWVLNANKQIFENKKANTLAINVLAFNVLKAGLEPACPCGHTPLKRARLPIPPLEQFVD
jgi:hypothetical protein